MSEYVTEHHCGMTAQAAKDLGLESILWLARVQIRRTAHLTLLHADASHLPPEWWMARSQWPIEKIITAIEQTTPESLCEDISR
jgi:hypothetical protein